MKALSKKIVVTLVGVLLTPVANATAGGEVKLQLCNNSLARSKCTASASPGDVQTSLEWRCRLVKGSTVWKNEMPPAFVRSAEVDYEDSIFATGRWFKNSYYQAKHQSVWRTPVIIIDKTEPGTSGGGQQN